MTQKELASQLIIGGGYILAPGYDIAAPRPINKHIAVRQHWAQVGKYLSDGFDKTKADVEREAKRAPIQGELDLSLTR